MIQQPSIEHTIISIVDVLFTRTFRVCVLGVQFELLGRGLSILSSPAGGKYRLIRGSTPLSALVGAGFRRCANCPLNQESLGPMSKTVVATDTVLLEIALNSPTPEISNYFFSK